jgi:hypothetical protein
MLTAQTLLEQNLKLLESRCSAASMTKLRRPPRECGSLLVDERSDGQGADFRLEMPGVSGDGISLHSRRYPLREARRQAEECFREPDVAGVIVVGFAGMYHLTEMARVAPEDSCIIVMDINPGLMREALHYCRLEDLLQQLPRIAFIVNDDIDAAKRELRMLLKNVSKLTFSVFMHPVLRRAFQTGYAALAEEINSELKLEASDRATHARRAGEWTLNAFDNLPHMLALPGVGALRDAFKGANAIVACAGPGLIDSIEFIKQHQAACPVFAVGTALRPLLAQGIIPDFVVALDSSTKTLAQIPLEGGGDCWLIASSIVPPAYWNAFPGRAFTYSIRVLEDYNNWLKSAGRELDRLNIGGTVSLTAVDAARLCGCGNIFLCGLDLALAEDGTTHAVNSAYGDSRLGAGYVVYVKGNYRRQVPTTIQFASYVKQMGAYFKDISRQGGIKLYNITTCGAFIDNTVVVKPDDFIDNAPGSRRRLDKTKIIYERFKRAAANINNGCKDKDFWDSSLACLEQIVGGVPVADNPLSGVVRYALQSTSSEAEKEYRAAAAEFAEVLKNKLTPLAGSL